MLLLLRKIVTKLILCCLVVSAVIFSGNLKDGFYRHKVGQAVVKVMNIAESGGGSGFHVETEDGQIYILTNKHVCELADEKGRVLIQSGERKMIRKVVERYSQHDLCLIEPLSEDEPVIDIAYSVSRGEDVVLIGHPGLRQLTLAHGEYIGQEIIEMVDDEVTEKNMCAGRWISNSLAAIFGGSDGYCVNPIVTSAISTIAYGGNSGSPVINKYGNVVGVLFAGSQQPTDSHMVPLEHIKAFLSSY